MIFNLALGIGLTIIVIAFISEYVDSTFGMGYGTTLTPVLLLMGFEPLQIVPIVLVSEAITGATAAMSHFKVGNVDFNISKRPIKIALILSACSIIGTIAAVFIAVSLPIFYLKLYIGLLVLAMGLFVLFKKPKHDGFAWKKIVGLGLLASFNKGVSGGGYGPVVTSGQILSGVDEKSSIGITSFAESLTCVVGVIAYMLMSRIIDWTLLPYLLTGALLSVPFSVYSVKLIKTKHIRLIIAITTISLGIFCLFKILL